MVKGVDKDGDGTVDFEEFTSLMERESDKAQRNDLVRYFKVFDSEGKGRITAERLKRTLDALGEPTTLPEAQAMVKYADLAGDGYISEDEFVRCFEQVYQTSVLNK